MAAASEDVSLLSAAFKDVSLLSAAFEAASPVWMELAMFAAAAFIYAIFVGVPLLQSKLKKLAKDVSSRSNKQELTSPSNARAVLLQWTQVKGRDEAADLDMYMVVDAMSKLGKTNSQIIAELRSALMANSQLLSGMVSLPQALLRDDALPELLLDLLALLAERGHAVEPAVYAGLMAAHLRRRNNEGVLAAAAGLTDEALTPRMRALLATAAANLGRLEKALGHLRQMPPTAEGLRCTLPSACVAQILSAAAQEQRIPAATKELLRICARLETRHFEEMLTSDGERRRGTSVVKELLEAGNALQVPKGPGTYQAMAVVCTRSSDGPGLLALVDDLEAQKLMPVRSRIPVTEALALALLEAVCFVWLEKAGKALQDGSLIKRIVELHRAGVAGSPGGKVLAAACNAFLACDQSLEACQLYEREMEPRGVWPDSALTASLTKAATASGNAALVRRLSDHAGAMKAPTPGLAVGGSELQRQAAMIKAFARDRDLASAQAVFQRLQASGATLSPLIYNCFLDACVHCGDINSALKHFEEMKRLCYVDVVGYNTVLKAYLSRGLNEEARALVKEMSARGLQANKVTYNELLHAKVIAKDRTGLWSILDEMQQAGVKGSSVTCSILLKSLTVTSSPGDLKRIVGLIDDMEEAIDNMLFSSVIEACIRIKQLKLLSELMGRLRLKGSAPIMLAAPTYSSMIKAYGQAGDVARVRELWSEMAEQGVRPTSITLGCMVEALVINNQGDEALELVHKQLECEEGCKSVNTVVYSTVLKGFAVGRRIDKVFAVYKEMLSKDIDCNTITYNTMLDACAKCCAMDRATSLLEDMKERRVEPDIITYSTIVKGYCLEGDLDRAFNLLEGMKRDGKFLPDEIMYNSILDGCAKQHRTDESLRVLEEMKEAGVVPSNYTLSIMVKLLGHARRLTQAFTLVEELSRLHGFRPNVQVYTCLVQACILNRRLDRALTLHDTVITDGCVVDEKYYGVLLRGCLQMHQPLKAIEVVRAAYHLPGHSFAQPPATLRGGRAFAARAVGLEARSLEECSAKLMSSGTAEDKAAMAQLSTELLALGVRIGEGGGSRDPAGQRRNPRGTHGF